jgi:hypothetical protein
MEAMFSDPGEECPIDADLGVARLAYALDLPALAEVAEQLCQGVSRFFDCENDRPDHVLTCLWLPSLVVVECVSGWSSLPPLERVDRLRSVRWVSRIPPFLLPGKLRGWERLCESLAAAPSCQGGLVSGGTHCFHSLLVGGTISNVAWSRPHPRLHRPQLDCIAAYRWLARIGRMCSLLPLQRKQEQRVRGLSWTASLS